MSNPKNFFYMSWSHGRYLDLWSFVHFTTGIILGVFASLFSLNEIFSFMVIISLLILYEGIEILGKVSEGPWNILLDIIVGGLGSAFVIFWLGEITTKRNMAGILSLSIAIALLLVSLGWKNFLKRKAKDANSYRGALYALYFIYLLGTTTIFISSFYWLDIL